eukprot:5002905-Lingulodinium_polyedra.AAC.1
MPQRTRRHCRLLLRDVGPVDAPVHLAVAKPGAVGPASETDDSASVGTVFFPIAPPPCCRW